MFYTNVKSFKESSGYEIDGKWYPRVTSIISVKAKPALYKFYADQPSFKASEEIKTKSAEEGTLLHEMIEGILRKEPIVIPDTVNPAVTAFLNFQKENTIVPHKLEEQIHSVEHGYAGTIDVLAELNGVLGVLDIKTSYGIYRDYNIQVAAYKHALEEHGTPPLERWILRLDQSQGCMKCSAKRRTKGGNIKVRGGQKLCNHKWGDMKGEVEIRALSDHEKDIKAFLACKALWEWENEHLLSKIDNYQR